MKQKKNLITKTLYEGPSFKVQKIQIEQNILAASGEADTQQLNDLEWEYW